MCNKKLVRKSWLCFERVDFVKSEDEKWKCENENKKVKMGEIIQISIIQRTFFYFRRVILSFKSFDNNVHTIENRPLLSCECEGRVTQCWRWKNFKIDRATVRDETSSPRLPRRAICIPILSLNFATRIKRVFSLHLSFPQTFWIKHHRKRLFVVYVRPVIFLWANQVELFEEYFNSSYWKLKKKKKKLFYSLTLYSNIKYISLVC